MRTMTLITGNTFPVKDAIKALGGRWDAVAKGWMVANAMAVKAQALVSGSPATTTRYAKYEAAQRPSYARQGRPCGYPGCTGRNFCEECSE